VLREVVVSATAAHGKSQPIRQYWLYRELWKRKQGTRTGAKEKDPKTGVGGVWVCPIPVFQAERELGDDWGVVEVVGGVIGIGRGGNSNVVCLVGNREGSGDLEERPSRVSNIHSYVGLFYTWRQQPDALR